MSAETLKLEFEIRKLQEQNKQLLNTNTLLNRQNKILNDKLDKKVEKKVKEKVNPLKKEVKKLKRLLAIKIDREQRLERKLEEKNVTIDDKNAQISALIQKVKNLSQELDLTIEEKNKYLANLNLDGKTAGIPTSQTPINKKKIIPNTRKKSDQSKGAKLGHKKSKLEAFQDKEINEEEYITLKECPHCHSNKLKDLGTSVHKDELDYEIRIIKKRYHFKEYECEACHKKVREKIPNNLKEDNQYGKYVQAHALSLTNVANVPFNKTRRLLSGLTSNEINLSEGYIAKLQKRASNLLNDFIKNLKDYILTLNVIYWDDTVIFVNKKRACLRFYGDNDIALYTAHESKGKAGLDKDNLLNRIPSTSNVVHDHNKVNYNNDYVYINVECCQHLERDLEKVKLNIPESTWSIKIKDLFSSYNKKRKEYIEAKKENFSFNETNDFMIKFDEYILLGTEENKSHGKSHYYTDEKTLLTRLIDYRDNYTYWLYDFSLPYTNNASERSLRVVKTKMKVSGQFETINYAEYYANIRSYIETCHRHKINEVDALVRLLDGNPYTIKEIVNIGKAKKEES